MCELLGMSAKEPTDITFSFSGLIKRGGEKGPHKDGWGITFYEGKGCRTFKDSMPCSSSPIAKVLKEYPIKAISVIAHIRQANCGQVALENTHPFTRELWGKSWTFVHNGQLSGFETLRTGIFEPVGTTDSEHAFCYLMNQLVEQSPHKPSDTLITFNNIRTAADKLRELGVFNMLLSNGEYVFAYCSTNLYWILRKPPFGKAKLIDEDMEIDFQQHTNAHDVVTIIATQPLTSNEKWNKLQSGEAILFKHGEVIHHFLPQPISNAIC